MNAAELKLDLFRRIDNMPKADLEFFYNKFIALMEGTSRYNLNKYEKRAIEEALAESEKGNILTHEDVVNEAKQKYPNLSFSLFLNNRNIDKLYFKQNFA